MAEYWLKYVANLDLCLYPTSEHEQYSMKCLNRGHFASIFVQNQREKELEEFLKRNHGLRTSSVYRAAWALILGAFTGQSEVCFYALQHSMFEGAGLGLVRASVEPEATIHSLLYRLLNDEEESTDFLFGVSSAGLKANMNKSIRKLCDTVLIDYNDYSAQQCLLDLEVGKFLSIILSA